MSARMTRMARREVSVGGTVGRGTAESIGAAVGWAFAPRPQAVSRIAGRIRKRADLTRTHFLRGWNAGIILPGIIAAFGNQKEVTQTACVTSSAAFWPVTLLRS